MTQLIDFDILDYDGNIIHSLKGLFSSSLNHLIIPRKDFLDFSNVCTIKRTYTNGHIDYYDIIDFVFLERGNRSRYDFKIEKQPIKKPIKKIEITNTSKLALDLSKELGINKEIITIFINNQAEIKKLFEESNFLTADSLVVAKETLIAAKTEENKLNIDKILNILGILSTIAESF